MINNSLVKYGLFSIYLSDKVVLIIKILLIENLHNLDPNSPLLNHLISEINLNNKFDIDKIDSEIECLLPLQEALNLIHERITQEGIYYNSNEFARVIYEILKQRLDRKSITKIIGEISSKFDKVILDELAKVIRISNMNDPFKIKTNIPLDNLIGSWVSIDIESVPDYGVNWNMTDYWVSRSLMKLEITHDEFSVIVPALDYTTKSNISLNLISGNLSIEKGYLLIETENLKREIPVLELNNDILILYLFKTKVQFQKQK